MENFYLASYIAIKNEYIYLFKKNCDYAYFIKTNIQYKESLYVRTTTDGGKLAPRGTRKNIRGLSIVDISKVNRY